MSHFLLFGLVALTGFRGIWVPRWNLSEHRSIQRRLDGRFNHIFLQVFANGEAYYPSALAPSRNDSGQWLVDFLEQAHRQGIQVSAWMNVFYNWGYAPRTADPRHPINAHPGWFLVDGGGRSVLEYPVQELRDRTMEGYYLAPGSAEVQDHLIGIAAEIITQYDFDGVHLDYIRYPGPEFTNDVHLRTKFARTYGVDPLDLTRDPALGSHFGAWGLRDLANRWQQFDAQDLSAFVARLTRTLKGMRPEILVSAAVKPNHGSARDDNAQDWLTWVNNGYLDFVCLMAYGRTIDHILERTEQVVASPQRVMIGLGLYREDLETIQRQISLVRNTPFPGYVVFSYETIEKSPQSLQIFGSK